MNNKKYYKLELSFFDGEDSPNYCPACCGYESCNGSNANPTIVISQDENKLKNLAKVINTIDTYDSNEYTTLLYEIYKNDFVYKINNDLYFSDSESDSESESKSDPTKSKEFLEYVDEYFDYTSNHELLDNLFWPKVFEEWKTKYNFVPLSRSFTRYNTCHKTLVSAKVNEVEYI